MKLTHLALATLGSATILAFTPAHAAIPASLIITEVDAAGSGTSSYGADWFELTNEGTTSISTAGDQMSDNNGTGKALATMTSLTLAAGQSVVFMEDDNTTKTDAQLTAAFETAWFGSTAATPLGFTMGFYNSSAKPGLGQGGDSVNIYNSSSTLIAGVSFGTSGAGTWDNSVAKTNTTTGTGTTDTAITVMSVAGVNGAFASATGGEIGSPGAVPEPKSVLLGVLAAAFLGFRLFRRKNA